MAACQAAAASGRRVVELKRGEHADEHLRTFIRRPIATSLLMLGVLVFGIVAYRLLPISALPSVDFPTITVTANYPGASPATMASAIATPLEQQFTAIPSLAQMTSLSGTGTTRITLQFDLIAQHRWRGAGRADRDSRPPADCCRKTCQTRRPIRKSTRPTSRY